MFLCDPNPSYRYGAIRLVDNVAHKASVFSVKGEVKQSGVEATGIIVDREAARGSHVCADGDGGSRGERERERVAAW